MSPRITPFLPGLAILGLWWTGWLGIIVPVALFAIKLLGLLLALELAAALTGDRRNRAILQYRWHSRQGRTAPRAAVRLAEAFGLAGYPPDDRGTGSRAMADLAERAVRLNLRHPNPLTGPLTQPRLTRALELAAAQHTDSPAAQSVAALATVWPQPQPDFSVGGVILDLRRFVGGLVLHRMHKVIRRAIAGERAIRRRLPAPRPQQRWRAADFPQHEIYFRARRMSVSAGLSPWNDDPALLPLRQQFRLAALTVLLAGEPDAMRRARLLAPFSGPLIDDVVSDLDRWAALHGHHPLAEQPLASNSMHPA